MKKIIILSLLFCSMLVLNACVWEPAQQEEQQAPPPSAEQDPPAAADPVVSYVSFTDYAGLFAHIQDVRNTAYRNGGKGGVDMAAAEAPAEEPAAMDAGATESAPTASADYSATNVQVAGIDEGDIVKTDGSYIYILRGNEVIILAAQGAETAEVNRFTVADEAMENGYQYASELYISDGRLVVIRNAEQWGDNSSDWSQQTEAALFDVSEPTQIQQVACLGQDGWYQTSRLSDGMLYLISVYYLYDEPVAGQPDTFVPCLYRDGAATVMAAEDVCICPAPTTSYVVMTAIDLNAGERISQLATLGSCNTVYMDADSLYIANSHSEEIVDDSYTESIYTVEKFTSQTSTEILRYDLDQGEISFGAGGTVAGYLIDQFAMDEYQGYLRLVAQQNSYSYTTYTDEERGFVNYLWEEDSDRSCACLYVLDEQMQVIGEIGDLAEGESVYSVRFNGDIGYFVTFLQVDPLFAVDLSDPAAPQVLSALKIPGFSEYLHPYGAGRLFGLGMAADAETGITEGLKLSMFDVSDPADVFETTSLSMSDVSWSEALYNHKAILVDADKDIIGFPVSGGYDVYGYTDAIGFTQRGHIDLANEENWYYDNCRGLYIDDYFYLCGYERTLVLSLAELTEIASIAY